ncbi:YaiI/YqxD family protein [Motiliproteus sediminis]|uniref:YaiI/YqxD family protein n=1 Tax=Motiliproteus sediminis TaxID=1468178 RepID=UPI001AEFE98C|nr:YaiI/YqxD family protein [Motiliproteus sediminis]
MSIWVDADACPNAIKEMLFRAAERTQTELTLVANQSLRVPPSAFIRAIRVASGFDVADNEIVRRVEEGDLVITSDIPLSAEVIEKGARVLSPRGEELTADNVRARLNMRDFFETLRSSGIQTSGPSALSDTDRREFANALDRYLAQQARS